MPGQSTESAVSYHVRILPARHEIEVRMTLKGPVAQGEIRVETPTWVPGDYEFRTTGRDLFDLSAVDMPTKNPLAIRREGWQAYQISGGSGKVQIAYSAYCSSTDFSEASGIIDDQYGILLGARFLFAPAHHGPCQVTYEIPSNWALHLPSGTKHIDERTWEYPSYEIM